ncbi:hypothetical protein DevBK_17105 [Devosia sp. BK]|uniref:hypothetical protein n=1 Tax=unclassified Devosia TaxID=196773 RepID=UPI0007161016|nr:MULTISPECIES: hypothetical protein [unclassified Devosia]KQT47010.1 hypothetical protein ASG47_10425 [Devosia sp. Leaf420]MDV3253061.1 hypothetical protein [Devosia sp. BK]
MKTESLEQTIVRVLAEMPKPDDALKTIRKAHPKVSKKQIIRAAFGVMIDKSAVDLETSRALQNFAISTHTAED